MTPNPDRVRRKESNQIERPATLPPSTQNRVLLNRLLLSPLAPDNASKQAYERLEYSIKFGFVPSGSKLPSERELVMSLGISRSTLREALHAMRAKGYVDSRTGRRGGNFVIYSPKPTSRDEAARIVRRMGAALYDALDLRSVIEPAAASLAAARATAEEVEHLQAILTAEELAPRNRRRQIDAQYHLAIGAAAKSPSVGSAVLDVQMRLHDMIAFVPTLDVTMRRAERQHRTIADAIVAGDSEEARAAMLDHVTVTANVLIGFAEDILGRTSQRREDSDEVEVIPEGT